MFATPLNADAETTHPFGHPKRVTLAGYDGDAMEPFVTRDGRFLLFNNRNDPSVNTELHFAERIDDLTFRYRGELKGVNTPALEGVPTVDRHNTLYFVSTRSYDSTLSTVYRGAFNLGQVSAIELVPGISRKEPRLINFDVDVNLEGDTLYFVDAKFGRNGPETADTVIARRAGAGFQRARWRQAHEAHQHVRIGIRPLHLGGWADAVVYAGTPGCRSSIIDLLVAPKKHRG